MQHVHYLVHSMHAPFKCHDFHDFLVSLHQCAHGTQSSFKYPVHDEAGLAYCQLLRSCYISLTLMLTTAWLDLLHSSSLAVVSFSSFPQLHSWHCNQQLQVCSHTLFLCVHGHISVFARLLLLFPVLLIVRLGGSLEAVWVVRLPLTRSILTR